MKTWSHPNLGKFKFTMTGWEGRCTLPSFKTFCFQTPGKSKLNLSFETDFDSDAPPTRPQVTIAQRIIKNEGKLSEKIVQALSADLNGRGDDSGMWWHGDIESVLEILSHSAAKKVDLSAESAITQIVGSPSVWIRIMVDDYEKPCGVICFEAAFDTEHGLGILTDGIRVLGIGYQMSVDPFFKNQFHGEE